MTDGELCHPSDPRWAAALRQVPHDVYHDPGYVALDAGHEAGRPVGFVYSDAGHAFLLPLVLRTIPGTDRLDATSPYGYPSPVSDTQDELFWGAAIDALLARLAAAGVVSCFVRMHPLLPAGHAALDHAGTLVYHGDTVAIDLRADEEEMWRQVRGNHRRHINRARRSGRTTVIDDWSYLSDFIDIYHETMRRVDAADYYFFPPDYFTGLRKALGDRLHLVVALADGMPIGGGLFFEECGIVQYHLGGSRDEYLPEQPAKLVIDDMRRWAAARGNTAMHLGAGVGGRTDQLFYFKAGFSDGRHEFHTWRLVVDPAGYERLTRARGTAGTAYFPAYRG